MSDYISGRGTTPRENLFAQISTIGSVASLPRHPYFDCVVDNHIVRSCCCSEGSRILQIIFETSEFAEKVELVKMLQGSECYLSVDFCASRVLQKIVHYFEPTQYAFIVMAITSYAEWFKYIIQNKYGSRVIETALKELTQAVYTDRYHCFPNEFQEANRLLHNLLGRLTENCVEFINIQCANYVIQHVITSEFLPETRDYIIHRAILGNVVALSREKVASNVVQKSFEYASPGVLYCLMNEVIYGRVVSRRRSDALEIMLFDKYANYVIQTMINVSISVRFRERGGDRKWLGILRNRISAHESRLQKYSYGRKIISTLRQDIAHRHSGVRCNKFKKPLCFPERSLKIALNIRSSYSNSTNFAREMNAFNGVTHDN